MTDNVPTGKLKFAGLTRVAYDVGRMEYTVTVAAFRDAANPAAQPKTFMTQSALRTPTGKTYASIEVPALRAAREAFDAHGQAENYLKDLNANPFGRHFFKVLPGSTQIIGTLPTPAHPSQMPAGLSLS